MGGGAGLCRSLSQRRLQAVRMGGCASVIGLGRGAAREMEAQLECGQAGGLRRRCMHVSSQLMLL